MNLVLGCCLHFSTNCISIQLIDILNIVPFEKFQFIEFRFQLIVFWFWKNLKKSHSQFGLIYYLEQFLIISWVFVQLIFFWIKLIEFVLFSTEWFSIDCFCWSIYCFWTMHYCLLYLVDCFCVSIIVICLWLKYIHTLNIINSNLISVWK